MSIPLANLKHDKQISLSDRRVIRIKIIEFVIGNWVQDKAWSSKCCDIANPFLILEKSVRNQFN